MIHTLTEVDRLIELAIIQRSELKKLVDSLPELRTHLSIEIEKNVEQIEPHLRAELEVFLSARAKDENAKLGELLESKIETLCDSLEITTAAKYSALSAYKENVLNIEKIAEKKIADAGDRIALEVPAQVDKLVSEKLANFPRATQLDQLRKEFAEPASLNPRGKWQVGETYHKLDLVSVNGSSYIANETTTDRPSSSSPFWTLSASRGNGGAGGGVTSLTDLVPVPNNGELLIGNGSGFVESTLTAGSGISITNGAGSITVTATGGIQFQGSWDASTNTPALTSSVGTTGYFYIVSVAGSTNLNGITDWEIGDWAIFSTSTWTKVDNTDKVSSVFGRVGSVVGVSTDYSAVGITNTALGASNPSTVAATTISATSTISATGAVTGSNLSGTNTGDQTNITGNAGTATALQTARAINGVNFDGTAAITVTAAGSTLSDTVPITKGGTGQITAQAALNALLPSQAGANGKNLQSDGTNVSFVADAGGTVTSVSVTTANGVSGTVATATTTPAISLTLGAITPTSVAASGSVTGSNLSGTSSGTNTGDQTITLTGDITGSGTGSFATAIASGVIVNADINASAAIDDTKLATISTASKVSNSATTATNANTASAIVARDASGNFSAGTISAALTGNVTGNVSGSSGSTTGNAATATALQTARAINGVSFDGTAAITVTADASTLTSSTLASGVTASSLTSVGTLAALTVTAPITGSVTGSSGSTTGNAATATALATGRTIAITGDLAYTSPSFDGTANVTAAGTLATVASAGTTGGSTAIPIVTINAKGLTTSITTAAVIAPAGTLSGNTLASGVTASSLTSLGTIASLAVTAGTISGTPSASTDIANKLYVDTVAQGLDAKASCVAATTADITLSGTQTIDGISVIAGNRVLVKNQTLSQNNGIYLCAAGAWTRTTDADTWDELTSAFTFIETGTVNADTGYVCTANAGGTLGTTALPWSQFSGAGSYTASTGLTLTGTEFSLTAPVTVALGGTNSTSAGIAAFNNISGFTAAGATGTTSTNLVFSTSPTLITPDLGTPTALVGTNITGTASGLTAGNVTTNANLTGDVTSSGNATTLTNAPVIAKVLTGYVSGAGTVAATDSILQAIQKLNGNDATNANLTGVITSVGNATSIASQTGTGSTFVVSGSPTITTPVIAQINDANGNETLKLASIASAVNEVTIENAATGNAVHISATGGDASVGLHLAGKGASGYVNVQDSTDATKRIMFNASGGTTNTRTMLSSTQTVDRTLSLPDATDTLVGKATTDTLTNKTLTSPTITGGALNGTLGATTPSTVAATTGTFSGLGYFNANNTGLLLQPVTSTTSALINFVTTGGTYYVGPDSSTAGVFGGGNYAMTMWAPTGKVVQIGIGGTGIVSTFTSTGLNSTAIGATTPSTGAFSTLGATGLITASANGQGISCASADANGSYLGFRKSGTTYIGAIGAATQSAGVGTVNDVAIDVGGANHVYITTAETIRGDFTAAGLAVTGTLSATSTLDLSMTNPMIRASTSSTQLGLQVFDGSAYHTTLGVYKNAVNVFFLGSGAAGLTMIDESNTSGANNINFVNSSYVQIGNISRITTTNAVAYNTTSDARLKENFRDFTDSGRLIDALKPRVFDWKDTDNNGKDVIGFIAQEEHAADPVFAHIGAVSVGDDDPDTITKQWQRSDAALIPILVAELQSLRKRLAALESK